MLFLYFLLSFGLCCCFTAVTTFRAHHIDDGLHLRFGLVLTVKECGIIGAPLDGEVVSPRTSIVQTPEIDSQNIFAMAHQHLEETSPEVFHLFLLRCSEAIFIGIHLWTIGKLIGDIGACKAKRIGQHRQVEL